MKKSETRTQEFGNATRATETKIALVAKMHNILYVRCDPCDRGENRKLKKESM